VRAGASASDDWRGGEGRAGSTRGFARWWFPTSLILGRHRGEVGPFDAVLSCLGVSSAGVCDEEYRRITFDPTVAVADVIEALSPERFS
jgi:hypothetical protein